MPRSLRSIKPQAKTSRIREVPPLNINYENVGSEYVTEDGISYERLARMHATIFTEKERARRLIKNFISLQQEPMDIAFNQIKGTPTADLVYKAFESFAHTHHDMFQYIRDIYNLPNIPQNGHFNVALFASALLGSHLDDYFDYFNRDHFFAYTYFVFEMDRMSGNVILTQRLNQKLRNTISEENIARVLAIIQA